MFLRKANKAVTSFLFLVSTGMTKTYGLCMSHLQEKLSEFDAGKIGVS